MFMDIFNAMVALATDTASSETDFYYSLVSLHSQTHLVSGDFAFEFIEAYDADDRAAMFNVIAAYAEFLAEAFVKGE